MILRVSGIIVVTILRPVSKQDEQVGYTERGVSTEVSMVSRDLS